MTDDLGPSRAVLYDADAEQAVLGSVFINPDAYDEVAAILGSNDFYLIKNRWVWDAFTILANQKLPIDVLTVSRELEGRVQLDEAGGVAYLTQLINAVPTSLHAVAYAQIVRRDAVRRAVLEYSTQLAKVAYDESTPVNQGVEQVIQKLDALTAGTISNTVRPIAEVMRDLYNHVEQVAENPAAFAGLSTGLKDLDAMLGGYFAGEMTVIVGEPGTGKSILAIQSGKSLAMQGSAGAIFEMEMAELQVSARLASAQYGVSTRRMRYGPMLDPDLPLVAQAVAELSSLPIWISTSTEWTTVSLRATLARLKRENNIEWFVLDFFDLLKDAPDLPSWERDAKTAYALHDMCKDLGLIGIVVHTLNKTGMGVKARNRHLGQAGGGSKIVYAADNVLWVDYFEPPVGILPKPEDENLRTISSGKVREDEKRPSITLLKVPGRPAFADVLADSLAENLFDASGVYRG